VDITTAQRAHLLNLDGCSSRCAPAGRPLAARIALGVGMAPAA